MRPVFALVAACATVTPIAAAPIAGNGNLGDFTGTFSYSAGTLTVSLTNAPSTSAGGKLTGFAFNLPAGVTVTGYTPAGPNGMTFQLLGSPDFDNSVPVSPYGAADTGAALGGDWTGGGSPDNGLAVGQTGTWQFQLAGMGSLDKNDIFNTPTTGGGRGTANFLVRFKGFDNGGSDKVPAVFGDPQVNPDGDPEVIPEPATLATAGVLAGLGWLGYRLKRRRG